MVIIRLSSTNGVSYQVCCSPHNKFQKLTGWRDRDWAGVLENQWKKWETKIPCFLRPTRVTGALHDGPTHIHYCDENVDVISLHSNWIQHDILYSSTGVPGGSGFWLMSPSVVYNYIKRWATIPEPPRTEVPRCLWKTWYNQTLEYTVQSTVLDTSTGTRVS
jgi:hypothetical protein